MDKVPQFQGRCQGRASPGPAALGPPFLAGPGSPGPAGPRCFQPCRVRAGPRARKAFASKGVALYNILPCCISRHLHLGAMYDKNWYILAISAKDTSHKEYHQTSDPTQKTSSSTKTAMEMRLLQYVDDDKKTAVLKNCRFEEQIDRSSCRNFHVLWY